MISGPMLSALAQSLAVSQPLGSNAASVASGENSFAALLDAPIAPSRSVPLSANAPAVPPPAENVELEISPVPATDGQPQPRRLIPKLFAFGELGMFGRHGAEFAGAIPATENPREPIAAIVTPATATFADNTDLRAQHLNAQTSLPISDVKADSVRAADMSRATPAPLLVAARAIGEPQEIATDDFEAIREVQSPSVPFSFVIEPANANIALPQSAVSAPEPEPETPLPVRSAGVFRADPRGFAQHLNNPVNLMVSGTNEALVIVARASGEAAPDLNRRIAETAAEFGMDIAEIRLNGSALEHPLATGGSHGRRAR